MSGWVWAGGLVGEGQQHYCDWAQLHITSPARFCEHSSVHSNRLLCKGMGGWWLESWAPPTCNLVFIS